uniref:Uncharacterized protein n=1 Tax=Glossina austeni TaxID=7395 RepID=A0A1A9UHI9_GLOAU
MLGHVDDIVIMPPISWISSTNILPIRPPSYIAPGPSSANIFKVSPNWGRFHLDFICGLLSAGELLLELPWVLLQSLFNLTFLNASTSTRILPSFLYSRPITSTQDSHCCLKLITQLNNLSRVRPASLRFRITQTGILANATAASGCNSLPSTTNFAQPLPVATLQQS